MAYDAARGVTILFGGRGIPGIQRDTWEWDGRRWARMETRGGPSARRFHAMAYDAARAGAVLFGGNDGDGEVGDTWAWRPVAPGLRMAARLQPAFGSAPFDCLTAATCPIEEVSVRARAGGVGDASTRVLLFEGEDGEDLDRVWSTDDPPVESLDAFHGAVSGAFILEVADDVPGNEGELRSWCVRVNDRPEACTRPKGTIPLNVPLRSFIPVDVDRVDRLEVEVHLEHPDTSELTIHLENDAAPGVDMQVWTGLRWETVAHNSAGPDAPEQLSYTRVAPPPGEPDDEADPLAGLGFSRLVFGETRDEKAINVRLKPKHPGGKRRDLGDLAADYLEVRVKYTHPADEAPPEPDP